MGKFIFFGRKKNRMKKFICSKRNKLEWEKSIESGGGELHTWLEILKGREVGGRDYCNDVFCNHKG